MHPLAQSFLQYLQYERNYSLRTIDSYGDDLRNFEAFVRSETGDYDPLLIDVDIVRCWMAAMGRDHLAVSFIKRRLCCLRSFCRYLRRQGLIPVNPLTLLPSPKVPKPLPVWINEAQMDAVIDQYDFGTDYDGVLDKLIIVLLYSTGMRRFEAAGLKDADVDMGMRQLRVLGKGNKQRLIPFGDELANMITAYRERRDAETGVRTEYLLTDIDGKPLTPDKVSSIVRRVLNCLPQLSRRGAHVLRHSFATNMLAEGADLMAVKELLGHASLDSTEVYTHLSPKELLESYKQAHPRSKE